MMTELDRAVVLNKVIEKVGASRGRIGKVGILPRAVYPQSVGVRWCR